MACYQYLNGPAFPKKTYTVVERDGVDDHKVFQVVHVRRIVAVPSYHVEGAVILSGLEQMSLVFVDDLILDVNIFKPG